MAERSKDWWKQAESDLEHARDSRDLGDHDWASFAAHQAAEKAIKALYQKLHMDAWGHSVSELLQSLPEGIRPGNDRIDAAKILDKNYIPTRYPNGLERGAPTDYYTRIEAEQAIQHAEAILEFCRRQIDR